MKTSILKASTKMANDLKRRLIKIKTSTGKPLFKEVEIENGFEIIAPAVGPDNKMVVENGKMKWIVIFRFTNKPAPKIEWDEKYITI